MDFEQLVNTRRSVPRFQGSGGAAGRYRRHHRGGQARAVFMNTQPWHVHVLTGEPLEQLRRRNMEEMIAGAKAKRDIVSHGEYQACIAAARSTSPRSCSAPWGLRATTSRCGRTGAARFQAVRCAGITGADLMTGFSIPARCATSISRALLRHRAGSMGSRPRLRHQRPGHHALGHRARGCRYPRG